MWVCLCVFTRHLFRSQFSLLLWFLDSGKHLPQPSHPQAYNTHSSHELGEWSWKELYQPALPDTGCPAKGLTTVRTLLCSSSIPRQVGHSSRLVALYEPAGWKLTTYSNIAAVLLCQPLSYLKAMPMSLREHTQVYSQMKTLLVNRTESMSDSMLKGTEGKKEEYRR